MKIDQIFIVHFKIHKQLRIDCYESNFFVMKIIKWLIILIKESLSSQSK